jgi:hypothetical protein
MTNLHLLPKKKINEINNTKFFPPIEIFRMTSI